MISTTARPRTVSLCSNATQQQTRSASLLRRPKRPYTFTQLITLSDGSTFTHRTTSPAPIYRSIKDTRNNPLWNPSSQKLLNIEEDEAGRLKRFRMRFGRGFDAAAAALDAEATEEEVEAARKREEESLMDMIGGFGEAAQGAKKGKKEVAGKKGKEGK